jgi:hypothetical protein
VCDTYRDHWLPSIKLFTDQFNVWKIFAVSKLGQPMRTKYIVQFLLGFTLDFWVAHHSEDKYMEGRNSL